MTIMPCYPLRQPLTIEMQTGRSVPHALRLKGMVDRREQQKAHKLERCPACGGMMRLGRTVYTCEKCGHFSQDPLLQDIIEQDDPANLRFCNCPYCLKDRNGVRL